MPAPRRCSALVRVLPDFSDLLLAHSAWFTYGGLVRVYKHYRLALADPRLPLRSMSFSSYPGGWACLLRRAPAALPGQRRRGCPASRCSAMT